MFWLRLLCRLCRVLSARDVTGQWRVSRPQDPQSPSGPVPSPVPSPHCNHTEHTETRPGRRDFTQRPRYPRLLIFPQHSDTRLVDDEGLFGGVLPH